MFSIPLHQHSEAAVRGLYPLHVSRSTTLVATIALIALLQAFYSLKKIYTSIQRLAIAAAMSK
ncbi:hypothetical protein OG21DRAFT_1484982 [Imleria badia]|nr:hypothetical protein OG21DRAFT_1484982 [Imleria badia]